MGDFDFGGGGGGRERRQVQVTSHANRRWEQRLPNSVLRGHPLTANTWHESERVKAPSADCDEQRLYQIYGADDMLLCGKYKQGNVVRIVTVLYADYDRLRRM